MNSRIVTMMMIVVIAGVVQARAEVLNGGFEDGFDHWSLNFSDLAEVVQHSDEGYDPTQGSWFARMSAGEGDVYTMLSQPFSVDVGTTATVTFDAYFQENDYANDNAYVLLRAGTSVYATLWSEGVTNAHFGWDHVSYTIEDAGTYQIEAGVENAGDNVFPSFMGLDNVNVHQNVAPEPGTIWLLLGALIIGAGWRRWRKAA